MKLCQHILDKEIHHIIITKVRENRAECLYNMVQYDMIMNTEMHWLRQNID